MAPADVTSAAPTLNSTNSPSDFEDFINTVGTAAGSILTLFGEQATKQFLSLSMGWQDNVLLAAGPIGILTIVVSAIRVGGYPWFKGILGRSRESRTTVEQEFLSSTSDEVCELWSGHEVVRVTGNPNGMKDLFIVQKRGDDHASDVPAMGFDSIEDMSVAFRRKLLSTNHPMTDKELEAISLDAPNLTLNIAGTLTPAVEKRFWTLLAICLQTFVFVFPAFATYHFKWLRKGKSVPKWAYWCFLSGSLAIMTGLFVCGHVVETSTTEHVFTTNNDRKMSIRRIIRFQMDCNVSSQHFPAYAILNGSDQKLIRSRLRSKNDPRYRYYPFISSVAVVLAITGFAVQLVGLSALHYSATITVLSVSISMTAIRAFNGRGLNKPPLCIPIPAANQLAWLAMRTVQDDWNDWKGWRGDEISARPHLLPRDCNWGIPIGSFLLRTQEGTPALENIHLQGDVPMGGVLDFLKILNTPLDEGYCSHLRRWSFLLGSRKSAELKATRQLRDAIPNIPKSDCDDIATRLAVALIKIRSLLVKGNHVRWRNAHVAECSTTWELYVPQGLKFKDCWYLELLAASERKLAENLKDGISLWAHSLQCRSAMAHAMVGGPPTADVSSLKYFLQIVGSAGSLGEAEVLTSELRLWIPEGSRYFIVPSYDGNWKQQNFRGLDNVPQRTVLGLFYSAFFICRRTQQTEESYDTLHFQPHNCPHGSKDIVVYTHLYRFQDMCALELVSLLLLTFCSNIEEVMGVAELEVLGDPPEVGEDATRIRHKAQHPLFNEIAQILVDADIVYDQAYAMPHIIPAFARYNLLPKTKK